MNQAHKEADQESKQEELIADFIQDRFHEDIPSSSISDGVTDYVLRCIQGPFAGNFIYINLTDEGELIGSDPQADYTLFIENAGLSAQHVKINYTFEDNQYSYLIRDLNSEKGTWIKTRPGHLIQIEDEMIFRIEDQVFQFRLIEDEKFDVVVEWLARIELKWVIKKLKSYNIKTLKDIKQLSPDIIDEIIDDEDEKQRFKQAFDTIDQDFPVDGQHKSLLIYSITQDEVLAKVKWSGAAITRSGENGEFSGMDKFGVDCNQKFEMLIQFLQNKYFFHVTPKAPGQIYLKLYGSYKLQPDDIVNIGSLDFLVQRFNTGMWSDKGTRLTMEDRSVVSQNIPISRYFSVSYFAVFDGHGGDQCAQFLYEMLGEKVKEEIYMSDEQLDDAQTFYQYIHEKLVYIIHDIDQMFLQFRLSDQDNNDSGSAGVIVFIFGTKLISVNIGDCRAVLSRNGKPVALTVDHKPYLEKEKERIMKAGGTVDGNRVNKKLAVSRAFGDFAFKKETTGDMDIVTCDPDIRIWDIDFQNDEFIVLGCDGIFDIFDNQQVVEFVREKLTENSDICEQDPQKVARQICLEAVEISKSQKRGSDNCSIIIVQLTRGIPKSAIK